MALINLHDFIENTIREFDANYFMQDRKLPESFKSYLKSNTGGEKFVFYDYTTVVRAELSIYCPNQWFYIAAYYCKLYPILQTYRDLAFKAITLPESPKDYQAFFASLYGNKDKALSALKKGELEDGDKNLLAIFLSDYHWWRGGKGIERNDFYYSPILSSAALVNQSQAYVADICKYLVENPTAWEILLGEIQGKSVVIQSSTVFESKVLVAFMEQCIKIFLQYDPNLSKVPFKANKVTIGFKGCPIGKLLSEFRKVTDDRRRDDCNIDIRWLYNNEEYCYWKEQNKENFDVFKANFNSIYRDRYEIIVDDDTYKLVEHATVSSEHKSSKTPTKYQMIFYGAPGTGKSHKVKEVTDELPKSDVFRTTFHPDSDYSTFVGCYKPTKVKSTSAKQPILDYDTLVDKFKEYLNVANVNITKACTLFGYDYHDSIVEIQNNGKHLADLVNDAYKSNTTYDSVVRGGMSCYESHPVSNNINSITYEFVPQAFINAYVRSYHTKEPVFLIIEEINRGNCAQIFGDIFQLLDRNCENGESDYAVKTDTDLQNYLHSVMGDALTDKEEIRSGEEMCLPSNLHIWATMNTSDQSLFPIDSAFKRRWDWQYMPINYSNNNWKINLTGNASVGWVQLQQKLNELIYDATESEDKMLGDWFIKANDNNEISEETLVGKIIFYLWNDVARVDAGKLFDFELERHGRKCKVTFSDFYNNDGTINSDVVKKWLKQIEVLKEEPAEDRQDTPDNVTSPEMGIDTNQ